MANKNLTTKIVMRNDSAENWKTSNPVLLAGEIGFENNTYLVKIGDGTSHWNDLEYYADYDATKIKFKQDITLAGDYTAVGNVKRSDVTLAAKGKSVADLFQTLFTKRLQPADPTQPAVTITLTGAGAKEVGTEFTPNYSASLSTGSYTYGPATGITATEWSVTDTNQGSATTATGSFEKFTVEDDTNYTITAVATHGAGPVALDNLGDASSPVKQITAGTKSKTSAAVTGYRNMFFGTMTTKPGTITSTHIRALATKQAKGNVTNKEISIPLNCLRVIFAVPADKKVTSITDKNGLGAQILSSFINIKVQVEGANAYKAIEYNVYYMDYANPNDKANTYNVTVA